MRKHIFLVLMAVFLMVSVSAAVLAATTSGTKILATGTAQYYASDGTLMPTVTSNTVTTTVSSSAGVSISPTSGSKSANPGATVDFAFSVTNTGNASDTMAISASVQNGSTVVIYQDTNGDGILESTETTKVSSTGSLAASGVFNCIAHVTLNNTGKSDTITITAVSGADATKTATSILTVTSTPLPGYIQTWLLNGYYSNTNNSTRLSTDYLNGEATVMPSAGSVSGGKTWTSTTFPTYLIDLAATYGNPIQCAGYACAYVYSPTAQSVNLWLGSDNGIKVWVNGTNVWTMDSTRGYTRDQDKVSINLNAGWNTLLLKISQYAGAWCFSAKVCDSSGNPITGITYSVVPPTTGVPQISSGVVTPGSTSATVTWSTDVSSTTIVDYGTTTSLGQVYSNSTLTTQHSANLTGLSPSTTYYFNVGSANSIGNIGWYNGNSFTTLAAPTTSSYIQDWLLNGYYSNASKTTRLSQDYLNGEASVSPVEGSTSGGKTWTLLDSPTTNVDLAAYYGDPTECVGYAFTNVYSPTAQTVNLWMGSDDGIKVWINGINVFTDDTYRACVDAQDKTTVKLNAGWNKVLVKISQNGGAWQFIFRVCDSNGNAISGITSSAAP
jgi:hypothetical protein